MSQWQRHRDLLASWADDISISVETTGSLINQCISYATAIANFYGDAPDQSGNIRLLNRLREAYEQISTNLGYTPPTWPGKLNEGIIANIRSFSPGSDANSISQNERAIELVFESIGSTTYPFDLPVTLT